MISGSERNVAKSTLDGVDVMGERLAEEVFSLNLISMLLDDLLFTAWRSSFEYNICRVMHFHLLAFA